MPQKKRSAYFGSHLRLFSNTVFEFVFSTVKKKRKFESALWWIRAWWIRQKMDSNFLDDFLLKGKRRQKNVVETKDDFQPVVRTHKLKACSQNHSSIKTPARSRNQSANFVPLRIHIIVLLFLVTPFVSFCFVFFPLQGMAWYGMVIWYGTACMAWYGMVWYGMV